MREIKFRARNANIPPCWIYGYFVIEDGGCFIVNNEGKFMVIAGTESQYTGREDKNGKEIYEGDNVKHRGKKYQVCWNSIGWGSWGMKDKTDLMCNRIYLGELEIIGNIYE